MQATKVKQVLYKPKKEKIIPLGHHTDKSKVTWPDVSAFLLEKCWENRGFILITFIILENVILLMRMK